MATPKDFQPAQAATISPTQAGQEFSRRVLDYQRDNNTASVAAWSAIRKLNPVLYARAFPDADRAMAGNGNGAAAAMPPADVTQNVAGSPLDYSADQLATMTQTQARQAFGQAVTDFANEREIDSVKAWRQCVVLMPNLYAKACPSASVIGAASATGSATTAASDAYFEGKSILGGTGKNLAWKFQLAPLKLANSTTPEEFNAAFAANGRQTARLNAPAVFEGVKNYYKQNRKDAATSEAADELARVRHPQLAQAADAAQAGKAVAQ